MKYFSINSVSKAYSLVSLETKDKFWGILAILYSIDNMVKPNLSYNINTIKLSSFLENTFRLKDKKTYENSNSVYSVVFSSVWIEKTLQNFLVGNPNILPIIVWAYRRHGFTNAFSIQELIAQFVSDFHISKEIAEDLFSLEHSSLDINYVDTLYDDIDLLKLIIGDEYDINKSTLKMQKEVAVANAGDLSRGPFFQPLYASLNTLECLTIYPFNVSEYYSLTKSKTLTKDIEESFSQKTHQQIYFGAPGTGKSFAIDGISNENNSVRTTFHPDSDYSTFVGCYKPVKKQIPNDYANLNVADFKAMADEINQKTGEKVNLTIDFVSKYAVRLSQLAEESDDIKSLNQLLISFGFHNESYLCKVISKTIEDLKNNTDITYEFIPQAFTTAYVNAWKNLDNPYYLVIEEINRGNCAQIFGDIFQLLDRDSSGMSSYKITPDKDLQSYLASQFKDCDIDEDIKSGEKMQLPSNLNILATMNTSDQSLFPIDSAFKRRWDWKYIPIDYTDNGHYITCGNKKYSWVEFLEKVNDRIESVTQSEDKKMGGWFVKPNGKEITADKFVSKVIFYLWNDIFKDFCYDGNSIFKENFDKFHKFFDFKGDVKLDILEIFFSSLNIYPISVDEDSDDSIDDFETDYDETIGTSPLGKKDNSKYSINGSGIFNKGQLAYEAVKMFVANNTELSSDEVISTWINLGIGVSNLVISEEEYNRLKSETKDKEERFKRRYNSLTLSDNSRIYITKGFTLDTISQFKDSVNKTDWNIHIERIS